MVDLDELCRLAAKQMLATALLAERHAYPDADADLVDEVATVWWWPMVTRNKGP
jgi:hypothetical protein